MWGYQPAGKEVQFTDEQIQSLTSTIRRALPKLDEPSVNVLVKLLLKQADAYIRGKRVLEGKPSAETQLDDLRRIRAQVQSLLAVFSGASEPANILLALCAERDPEAITMELQNLLEAADIAISDMTSHGGRREDPFLNLLVLGVRNSLIEVSVKPGRSKEGPFRQILDAVFASCGVNANAEHCIRKLGSSENR